MMGTIGSLSPGPLCSGGLAPGRDSSFTLAMVRLGSGATPSSQTCSPVGAQDYREGEASGCTDYPLTPLPISFQDKFQGSKPR